MLVKYRNTHVLLRQPYIRDESLNVAQLLDSVAGQIRENIVIRRFVRWEITREPDLKYMNMVIDTLEQGMLLWNYVIIIPAHYTRPE